MGVNSGEPRSGFLCPLRTLAQTCPCSVQGMRSPFFFFGKYNSASHRGWGVGENVSQALFFPQISPNSRQLYVWGPIW